MIKLIKEIIEYFKAYYGYYLLAFFLGGLRKWSFLESFFCGYFFYILGASGEINVRRRITRKIDKKALEAGLELPRHLSDEIDEDLITEIVIKNIKKHA